MRPYPLFILLIVLLSACSKELADEIDYDALTAQGVAQALPDCAPGFEGVNCDQRQIDRFLGTYLKGQVWCTWTETEVAGPHRISESPLGSHYFQIEDDLHDAPFQAEVDGWNFSIPRQNNSITNPETGRREASLIEGSGWLDMKKKRLTYQLHSRECQIDLYLLDS